MAKKRKKNENKTKDKRTQEEKNLEHGRSLIRENPFFHDLMLHIGREDPWVIRKGKPCCVTSEGKIYVDKKVPLTPNQWAHMLIHCRLHLAFGHFDADKMPGYEITGADGQKEKVVSCDVRIWNLACDAYIVRFLKTLKFGEDIYVYPFLQKLKDSADEQEIYEYLIKTGEGAETSFCMDMEGLENPIVYDADAGEENEYALEFAVILAESVSDAVCVAGGHDIERGYKTRAENAAEWFINHYPLLGALAASFRIEEDTRACILEDIQVAAVNTELGIIYINPAAGLDTEELKFVLAHEYLHAGLQHQERCQGRDPYLWNVACDFVINGWLQEMAIGKMPEIGALYDETLKGMSAEEIYDLLLSDMRSYMKLGTLRGYGKGDIFRKGDSKERTKDYVTLDDFYKEALMRGLEYHQSDRRGYIPAGLIEEIRALAMPPIPWDVKLARWFEQHFALLEPRRTYVRPSRRQSSTPDIPRPRYVKGDTLENAHTFGVVIDTSGSISSKMIGIALGSIASYATAREVPYVRVVFCDATAYDMGYLSPEEIAGRVLVKGRGGTILQPGVDLLEKAADFPKNGPILIITDGLIEDKLYIHHEHAFLMPKGNRLPFKPKGKVFYYE